MGEEIADILYGSRSADVFPLGSSNRAKDALVEALMLVEIYGLDKGENEDPLFKTLIEVLEGGLK